MKISSTWLIVITIIAAVGVFLLSRVIWPDPAGVPMPEGAQIPFLIAVSAIESISFGVGIAFLVSLWSFMKGRTSGDWLAFISAAWLLISWWPHDNLHRVMMMGDYWQLIRIEWGFHVTLIAASVVVASVLWKKFAMEK